MTFFIIEVKGKNLITAPHTSKERYDSNFYGSADRGTGEIAKRISNELGFTLILPKYSRFIIDFNKPKTSPILTKFKTHKLPKISIEEREMRLKEYEKYYEKLKELSYKNSLHISIHSMTSIGAKNTIDEGVVRPDFRLGTLNGKSIKKEILDEFKNYLMELNFTIEIDNYFEGGEEIKQTSRLGLESLQIEINSRLILDYEKNEICSVKIDKISEVLICAIKKILLKLK